MSEAIEIPQVESVKKDAIAPLPKRKRAVALEGEISNAPMRKTCAQPDPKFNFSTKPASKRKVRKGAIVSFLFIVAIPFIAAVAYYSFIASDQYRSEALFSVRGTTTSPLASLGMLSLPGATAQSGDSYIVTEYIRSPQIIFDIQSETGLDLRTKFAGDGVDWLYRIDRSQPMARFIEYWRWMTAVEYNSTTGVISFNVDAFSAEDAHEISQAVLRLSEKLVNKLSEDAKQQVLASSVDEVRRNEERLNQARRAVEEFRNKEQIVDITGTAEMEMKLLQELQKQELELMARRDSLLNMASNSPLVKSLDSQIAVVREQIAAQKEKVGTGTESSAKNISSLATEYQQLLTAQEFAQKAYIAAQEALETATQEARKQERYLAVVLAPTLPDYAMYPQRIINVLMVLFGAFFVWLLTYLLAISVREHTR